MPHEKSMEERPFKKMRSWCPPIHFVETSAGKVQQKRDATWFSSTSKVAQLFREAPHVMTVLSFGEAELPRWILQNVSNTRRSTQ